APGAAGTAPQVPGGAAVAPAGTLDRAAALAQEGPRLPIRSPRRHGSIALMGARLDDVTLANYHVELSKDSAEVSLLSPKGAANPYYAEFGWVAGGGQAVALPGPNTPWTADAEALTPEKPVTLTWDNGQGLVFKRTIALDTNYMFTVKQTVENTGAAPVTLFPYGLIARFGTPKTSGFYILHEGPLGVFDGALKDDVSYENLKKDGPFETQTTGGWLGITDKYWQAALIPAQKASVKARFLHSTTQPTGDMYQADYLGGAVAVPAGGSASVENHLFAGAKEVELLDSYVEDLGITLFDRSIDFGWFYWLTKPIFIALLFIHKYVGNMGIAILLLTVAIKAAFYPLANKSYVSMSKMRKLQPEMTKLRERFGEDKVRLNQEMMALYKKEKANPASGCLPILIQIPVFFALYKVLFVTIEMRHAPFFGWIQDLSAPDPTTVFNLFGLIAWTPPDFLMIGVWPLIMGLTMWLQQRLNPQPPDPIQAKIFMFLPIMFTFMLARFPAGLVVYWAWNNTLSIIQQRVIMYRMGVK
ncbi:MAG: membrane protein insertase YidC, partial [Rhodobacterales bacterium]|nr:membrane protein insertase YidC [Rhodobacterales bacterium]